MYLKCIIICSNGSEAKLDVEAKHAVPCMMTLYVSSSLAIAYHKLDDEAKNEHTCEESYYQAIEKKGIPRGVHVHKLTEEYGGKVVQYCRLIRLLVLMVMSRLVTSY